MKPRLSRLARDLHAGLRTSAVEPDEPNDCDDDCNACDIR